MKKFVIAFATILVMMLSLVTPLFAVDVPDSVDEYFLDDANVLSEDVEYDISEKNYYMDRHSGAYIEVVTQDYINCDILDYSYTLFNEWGIGSAQKNNGILLVAVIQEEKYYVLLGRGLESEISLSRVDEILETYFEPYFDDAQYETAIVKTFDALYAELVNIYGQPSMVTESGGSSSMGGGLNIFMIFFWIVLIIFVIALLSAIFSRPRGPRTYYTHRYRQPMYRTRPYHVPPPVHRGPTMSSRPRSSMGTGAPRSSFSPSRSSSFGGSSRGGAAGSSFGSRGMGGSSRGAGGGRR